MRELGPTARVARGTGPINELPQDRRDLSDLQFISHDGEPVKLAEMLAGTYSDAFLVLHRGRVIVEEYFNGMGPRSLYNVQSISKSITGTLAGILIAAGELDPAETVTTYVPELAGTSWEGATLRDVLDMRAGTRWNEFDADPEGADARSYDQVVGWHPQSDPQGANDLYTYISQLENLRPHGRAFEYRSILTDLLGWILESVSGMRYAELLSRELWAPLETECDAEVLLDRHCHPLACGGISTTLRDLAGFGQSYVAAYRCAGQGVIPASWVSDCWQGDRESRAAFTSMPESPLSAAVERFHMYRSQWWVPRADHAVLIGLGVYGQALYIDFESDSVIVKLSSWPEAASPRLFDMHMGAFGAIVEALQDEGA